MKRLKIPESWRKLAPNQGAFFWLDVALDVKRIYGMTTDVDKARPIIEAYLSKKCTGMSCSPVK